MRIAITSQNFRTITGHAGKTKRFLVLEGAPGGEPHEAERLDLDKEMSFHEFQGGAHPIDGCEVLITQSCGFGFRQKLARRGIRVVVTGETDPVKAARAWLNGEPLPEPVAETGPHAHQHGHQHQHGHAHHHGHAHGQGGCGCGGHGSGSDE